MLDDNDIVPLPPEVPEVPGIIEQAEETVQAAANAAVNVVGSIQMVQVQSSDISAWGYDPVENRLQIQFTNGRVYVYESISPMEFESLSIAPSKGKAFWALVRRNPVGHPFTRIQ